MTERQRRSASLPLQSLFDRLRRAGVPLGVAEFLAAQQALQAGFGLRSLADLRRMCLALWIKSVEEQRIFDYIFDDLFPISSGLPGGPLEGEQGMDAAAGKPATGPSQSDAEHGQKPEGDRAPEGTAGREAHDRRTTSAIGGTGRSRTRTIGGALPPLSTQHPTQPLPAWLGRGRLPGREVVEEALVAHHFNLLREYQPLTPRQMKQSWRFLRRMRRHGRPVEFDARGTADRIARDGLFLEPVLRPARRNVADLNILVDWGGSMVPFHSLVNRLVETAVTGGRMAETDVFYFRNRLNPAHTLAHDRYLTDHMAVKQWLNELSGREAVLIVSDAGAARRRFVVDRALETWFFLETLRQKARYIAWLNPLPVDRWPTTTAGLIAGMVPMFAADRQGLENAIKVLRGRRVSRSTGGSGA